MKVLIAVQCLKNDVLIVEAGKKYKVVKVNWTKPYIRSYTIIGKNKRKIKIPRKFVAKEIK